MKTPGKLLLSKLFRNCAFWSDLVAGLREMRRVLRPGGFAAVAVECADPVAARVWIDLVGRMTVRTPEQLAAAFREAGFTDVTVAEARGPGATRYGCACILGRKAAESEA